MLNQELFAQIAPEITLTPEILEHVVPVVEEQLDENKWGAKYTLALVYLLAHTLTLRGSGRAVGMVTSESVGSLSRSYGTVGNMTSELGSTGYGLEFIRLRKQLVITPISVC